MRPSQASFAEPGTSSFASILSSLANGSCSKNANRNAWSDESLEDDIVQLSYEQALRMHARRKPAEPDPASAGASHANPLAAGGAQDASGAADAEWPKDPSARRAECGNIGNPAREARKTSSMTVRLSQTDCEKLHARAAEAGLTVSAYLRSCAFEVESLRAQVKDALAQMRQADDKQPDSAGLAEPRERWHLRFFPRWNRRGHAADA